MGDCVWGSTPGAGNLSQYVLPATQVNSAWPSLRGYAQPQMSSSQRVVMLCGWGVKAVVVHVWVARKTVIP